MIVMNYLSNPKINNLKAIRSSSENDCCLVLLCPGRKIRDMGRFELASGLKPRWADALSMLHSMKNSTSFLEFKEK